jgi:predicted metal-binding protein
MYPKNVINKKTEHQIQITKSCKKAWQETRTRQAWAGQPVEKKL